MLIDIGTCIVNSAEVLYIMPVQITEDNWKIEIKFINDHSIYTPTMYKLERIVEILGRVKSLITYK